MSGVVQETFLAVGRSYDVTVKRVVPGMGLEVRAGEIAEWEQWKNIIDRVFGSKTRATLGLREFLTAVGKLKFRGTSLLLRSPISILSYLAVVGLHDPVLANGPAGEEGGKSPRSISLDKSGPFSRSSGLSIAQLGPGERGISPVSGNAVAVTETPFLPSRVPRLGESFELATHSVKVKNTGTVVNVSTLWDFEGGYILQPSALLRMLQRQLPRQRHPQGASLLREIHQGGRRQCLCSRPFLCRDGPWKHHHRLCARSDNEAFRRLKPGDEVVTRVLKRMNTPDGPHLILELPGVAIHGVVQLPTTTPDSAITPDPGTELVACVLHLSPTPSLHHPQLEQVSRRRDRRVSKQFLRGVGVVVKW
ncbi:unnamed protein product, partial [Cyprideis torosa]